MRSFNQLRHTRIGNRKPERQQLSAGALGLAPARGRVFLAALFVMVSLVAFTGLSRRLGLTHLLSLNDSLMAAEAVSPAQPAPPPQGYQPAFRDLAGINGGALRPDLMSAMKIGSIRFAVPWNLVEPARGRWNWNSYDTQIKGGLAQKFEMIVMLGYTAPWAAGGADGFHPPQNPSDWTDYVTAVVSRYSAAPYNLKYFQVWNEPTKAAGFWKGVTDQQWVDVIYLPAARIIRDHGARVVFGGWPLNGPLPVLDSTLQYHNAWQLTDIVDVHYLGLPAIQQIYSKWVATGKCKGVWETEVGAVNNPVYLTNLYSGVFRWAKTSGNWTFPDQYKLFWYPPVGTGCGTCLATQGADGKAVPTPNGLALERVAQSLP